MEPVPEIARLSAAVDEVVVPAGFSAAQGGCSGGSGCTGGWVWCAATADVIVELPSLGRALALGPPQEGVVDCTDLVVDLINDHGTWRVTRIGLEGHDVDALLEALDEPQPAAVARALVGASADECAAQLPGLLLRVLELGRAPLA